MIESAGVKHRLTPVFSELSDDEAFRERYFPSLPLN